MTVRLKLFLLMAGVTVFSTMGVTAVALWRELQRGQELLFREGTTLAGNVSAAAARFVGPEGARPEAREALEILLRRLLSGAPLARAWVVDRTGQLVACAGTPGERETCPEGMPSEFAPAESPVQALLRLITPEGIIASAPVLRDGELVGAVRGFQEFMQRVDADRLKRFEKEARAGLWDQALVDEFRGVMEALPRRGRRAPTRLPSQAGIPSCENHKSRWTDRSRLACLPAGSASYNRQPPRTK